MQVINGGSNVSALYQASPIVPTGVLSRSGACAQVVIAGKTCAEDTEALLNTAHSVFAPDRVIIAIDFGDAAIVEFWKGFNPEVLAMVEAGNLKQGGR